VLFVVYKLFTVWSSKILDVVKNVRFICIFYNVMYVAEFYQSSKHNHSTFMRLTCSKKSLEEHKRRIELDEHKKLWT